MCEVSLHYIVMHSITDILQDISCTCVNEIILRTEIENNLTTEILRRLN